MKQRRRDETGVAGSGLLIQHQRRRRLFCTTITATPMRLLLLLLSFHLGSVQAVNNKTFRFALCPKSIDNPFFDISRDGCYDRAKTLSNNNIIDDDDDEIKVECLYIGPEEFNSDGVDQAAIVMAAILSEQVDGLSISVTNPTTMRPVIDKAIAMGLPVVTYDSDIENTERSSYIGTDNFFFGQQLGKVLQKIAPTGGTYAIVTDSTPNIIQRERGVRDTLSRETLQWTEISASPSNMEGNVSLAIQNIRELAATNVTAIVPVMGGPMFLPDEWSALVADFPDTILVVGDDLPVQLQFLSRTKVHGLVGQVPYLMGAMSMDSLLKLATTDNREGLLPDFQGTDVVEHLLIPLVLPALTVNENHLGHLSIVGFALFSIIAVTSIGFGVWTFMNKTVRVVKVAQPGFLIMVAAGSLVMGSTLIPLSFDDSSANFTETNGTIICMSPPWLAFIGFTITFSALFAKTWRVNRIFHTHQNFQRQEVSSLDVLLPFVILMVCNMIVLLVWSLVDPLMYVRQDAAGTDAWNRVISTYGTCVANQPWPYMATLAVMNVSVLIMANYQAYRARGIESEFSESKYIGMTVASMLQATLIGAPILILVQELPQAWYLTLSFIIFIISMMVLLLIFVPKISYARSYVSRSEVSQRRIIRNSIYQSQANTRKGSRQPGGTAGALAEFRAAHAAAGDNTSCMYGDKSSGRPENSTTSYNKDTSDVSRVEPSMSEQLPSTVQNSSSAIGGFQVSSSDFATQEPSAAAAASREPDEVVESDRNAIILETSDDEPTRLDVGAEASREPTSDNIDTPDSSQGD